MMQLFRRFFILSLLLTAVPVFSQDNGKTTELLKILEDIAKQHNIKFSYIEEDTKRFSLIPPPAELPLQAKLTYIANRTGINYRQNGDYIAIYIDIKLKLPKICGYITDENNLPLQDAIVQFAGITIASGADGYFEIKEPPTGTDVYITHIAFEDVTVRFKDFTDDCKKITLISKVQQLEEVVAERYLTTGISKKKDGSFIIKPKQFGILPGLIEPDVLQAMQQLPGVNSIDETVSNINVRGGTHDQNLFTWNGIRLFQTGHFFGLISVLNPNLARQIKISKNGTSAFYGESVSSTVDISSRSNTIEPTSVIIGSNMINAEFYSRVKATEYADFEISGRRSFTDVIDLPTYQRYSNRIFQNTVVTELNNNTNIDYRSDKEFYFYDFTAQYHQKLAGIHDLYIDALAINNNLDFTEGGVTDDGVITRNNTLQQTNYGISGSLKSKWSDGNSSEVNFYRSYYDVFAKNESLSNDQETGQKNKIRDLGMSFSGCAALSDYFNIYGGYQFNLISIENYDAIDSPYFPVSSNEALGTQALIGEIDYTSKNNRLYTKLGFRANYIDNPALIYGEPRLQLTYDITNAITFQLLGERKSQTASQVIELQDDFLGIEKRRWVLTNNNNIPLQKSAQVSAGVTLKKNGWLVSVDNFYKNVTGITTIGQGFQNQLEAIDAIGQYTVTGTEFLIQKQFTGFYTWLSYTWNNNNYTFNTLENIPAVFPSNFEIQHTISSAAIYEFKSLKIALGSKWYTGRPYTTPANGNLVSVTRENPAILYSNPNSQNLSDFFQVNFSASYIFSLAEKTRLQLGVSVLNIFNRQNIINRYYRMSDNGTDIQVVNTYSIERTPNALIRLSF